MNRSVIAIDIAKKVFQLHRVDPNTGAIERLKLKRGQILDWFARREPVLVAMEAGGSAHEWARQFQRQGHTVRLLPPKAVRPFVQRSKTDASDAQAIWTASQQPGFRFVPVKSEAQQAVLALHRMRSQLLKMRIMQTNELRGLLYEFGIVLPEGHAALLKAWPQVVPVLHERLPATLVDSLLEQRRRVDALHADITAVERRLVEHLKNDEQCRAIAAVPGVGLLTATAAVATMGSPAAFANARQFAAWLGLTPRQRGTGGRIRQLGISKRGDAYLRTLLMHGARAVIVQARAKQPWPWLEALLQRRPYNVVVAAVANKIARTLWAMLARSKTWREEAWIQPQTV
jgi:transposase